MKNHPFVGLAGNIGVGKTTFTEIVAEKLGWTPYFESVDDNPYLGDFYGDMSRWSFNLQVYFLHKRFKSHHDMSLSNGGVIQDRTIYEDVEIFARNLNEMGFMDQRDWKNYRNLFSIMTSYLHKPDLIVYLKASTDTLLSRIKSRSRDYEKSIDPEYLHTLNVSYNKWISNLIDIPVLLIETDGFNIFEDNNQLETILNDIQEKVS
ncbi:MAG: deoxynucleoside kinase [Candidatus Marinimicrobia bacterium]|nr:deoxynucleoside kinase [Candidatus Neomarinimicrobiota bacterium]MDP7513281.1 deoxynucleoside kinase [Candidatus Neomarinimicrobiota bacterium]